MADKDCLFLISYFFTFASFILFIVSFGSPKWISYDQGYRGLWKECHDQNKTDDQICAATTLAEGPAFLDCSRTLLCFALVGYVFAVYGYVVGESGTEEHTLKSQLKYRIQECFYFLAGVLNGSGCIVYGLNYHEYHANELNLKNLEFDFAFYMSSTSAGIAIIFSILLACSRETGLRKTMRKKTRSFRLMKAPDKPQAKRRNIWLKNKAIPTPVNQKDDNLLVVEEEKKEVPIKSNNLGRFILPVTVLMAVRRLQKGQSRNGDKKGSVLKTCTMENDGQKEVTMNLNKNDKYKGIFTINVDNRNEPMHPPVKETGPVQIDVPGEPDWASSDTDSYTESFSSSDGEINVKVEGHTVPMAERVKGKADEADAQEQTSSTGGNQQRPKVRRSVTTLAKGQEPDWTKYTTLQSPERPPPPRKTVSHGPTQIKSRKATAVPATSIPESNISVYTLPSEPGPVPPSSIVNYEDALVRRGERDAIGPQPVVTRQTKIYQPYL